MVNIVEELSDGSNLAGGAPAIPSQDAAAPRGPVGEAVEDSNRDPAVVSLHSEMARSHVASLLPVALFAVSLLWKALRRQARSSADSLVQLAQPLLALTSSLQRLEQATNQQQHQQQQQATLSATEGSPAAAATDSGGEVGAEVSLLIAPVTVWDVAASNPLLEFTEDNRCCRRPGSASCYPAAFAQVPASRCVFSVTLTDTNAQSVNWLSIGVCHAGFQAASSDGFGRTNKSW